MTKPGPRDVLLGKAIGYYAEHGVRDTSLRTLATAIGTSQRMLHYHFGSREELLAAVVVAVVESDMEMLDSLVAREQDPIAAGRENWRVIAERATRWGPLFFELSAHAMYGAGYARPLGEAVTRQAEIAFAQAYRNLIDDEEALSLARLTVAVGRGVLFQLLIDGNREAADAAIEEFIGMVSRRLIR